MVLKAGFTVYNYKSGVSVCVFVLVSWIVSRIYFLRFSQNASSFLALPPRAYDVSGTRTVFILLLAAMIWPVSLVETTITNFWSQSVSLWWRHGQFPG